MGKDQKRAIMHALPGLVAGHRTADEGRKPMAKAKTKEAKQKVTFTYLAPKAQSVLLAGDFTGWQHAPLKLKRSKDGTWKTTVSLPAGTYEYRLLVDGQWENDPQCINRKPNQFGGDNCVCIVAQPREVNPELV
jgi:5'-AMP-activated protein kinase regulatory beta subunit